MTKPDFQNMSVDELRAYMLTHREDEAAFHILMDRLATQTPLAVLEPEDNSDFQEVIRQVKQLKQRQRTQQTQGADTSGNS